MHISKLEITNFRNFKNAEFKFKKGINTLIGENSSGKSNTLYAIRLLLDENLPISASNLVEKDFNQNIEDWKGHWIVLKLTFNDLDKSEAANFVTHNSQNMNNKIEVQGTYSLFFRPKKKIRKQLFEISKEIQSAKDSSEQIQDGKSRLSDFLKGVTIDDYESVYSYRVDADFNDVNQYESLVGNFEKGIFPDPEQEDKSKLGNVSPHITLIKKEISCTFVKALRDVIVELKQKKSSPLLKLLRGTTNKIEVTEARQLTERVKSLNKDISLLEEIHALTEKIKSTLNRTLGFTYSPNVNIKSELPEEVDTLLQSLTLWVGDDFNSNQGKLEDLSLGGANLLYITLKLLEYDLNQDKEEKSAHFLLIEEPEAHIHTHVQKTLFDKYSFENTQVIITTHSTHISSASKIDSMNILIKEKGLTQVCQPNNKLDEKDSKRVERYLDALRSNLLFAKGVILVEGDAELIMIPAMFKSVFGVSLDEIGISVINVSSTAFQHIADLFNDVRIRRKCTIITDLDQSIEKLPKSSTQDNDEQKKMRASQEAGRYRKELLDERYRNNSWVNVFYAPHTFEIDFAINSNENAIKSSLKKIYTRDADITSSEKKLDSKDDMTIGKEALRLAKKEGKGWFALLISESLNFKTNIPEYILRAIATTSINISEDYLIAMAKYRLIQANKISDIEIESRSLSDLLNSLDLIKKDGSKDILTTFSEMLEESR